MSLQTRPSGRCVNDTRRTVSVGSSGRTCCHLTSPRQRSQHASSRRSLGCRVVPNAAPTMAVDTQQQWRQQREGADLRMDQGTGALHVVPATPTDSAYTTTSSTSSSSWDGSSGMRNSSSSGRESHRPISPSTARRTPLYVPIVADPVTPEDQSGQVYEPKVWQPLHQQQWEQRQRQQQQERRRKQRLARATPQQAPPAAPQVQQQQRRRRQDDQHQQRQQQRSQTKQQTGPPSQQRRTQQESLASQLPDWLTMAETAAPTGAVDMVSGQTAASPPGSTSTLNSLQRKQQQQQQPEDVEQQQQQQQKVDRDKQQQGDGEQVTNQQTVHKTPVPVQLATAVESGLVDTLGPRATELQMQVAAVAATAGTVAPRGAVQQPQVPAAAAAATAPAQAAAAAALAQPSAAAAAARGVAAALLPAAPIPAAAPAVPAAAAAAAPLSSRGTRSARQQRYRRTLAAPPGPLVVEEPALLALRGVSPEAVQAAAGMRGRAVSPGPGGGPLYPGRLTAEEEAALCAEFQRARKALAAREALPPGSTLEDWAAAAGQDPVTLLQQEERGAAAKQALMAAYEGLIVKTAKYFASVSRLSWEELLVEARAGFLDAVASFDATRGARLSSIAPIRINFALNSAKLAHSAPTPLVVPYAERHLQQRVVSLRGQLQATLGRKPTLKELAAAGGLPVERVRQLLDMDAWQPLALDARLGNQEEGATVGDTLDAAETETEGFTMAEGVGRANSQQQEAAVRQAMLLLLSQLSPRNRTALCMKLGLDLGAAEQLANNTAALEAAAAAAPAGKEGERLVSTSKKKRGRPSRSLPAAVAAPGAAGEAVTRSGAAAASGSGQGGAPRKLIVRDGLGEMTSREIAEHLGLTRQGVDTVLATALKQLRSKLQQLEHEEPEVLQALLAPADKGEVRIQLPGLGLMDEGAAADKGVTGDVQSADSTTGRKTRRGRPPKQAVDSK